MSSRCDPCKIVPYLYLGNKFNAANRELLVKLDIKHVIDIGSKNDKFHNDVAKYYLCDIPDSGETDIVSKFDCIFKVIDGAIEKKENVLVHCREGISRSATVMIGYMMTKHDHTYDSAYEHVQEKRPCISPNMSFLVQLQKYEKRIKPKDTDETNNESKSEVCCNGNNGGETKKVDG